MRPARSPTTKRILERLSAHPAGATTAVLAQELELSIHTVGRACQHLYAYGKVGKDLRYGRVGRGHPVYCVWRPRPPSVS